MDKPTSNNVHIRWQCRRGMLELDLLLLDFFDHSYHLLSAEEQKDFIALLAFSDQQLYGWLIGRDEPLSTLSTIVKKIREALWRK